MVKEFIGATLEDEFWRHRVYPGCSLLVLIGVIAACKLTGLADPIIEAWQAAQPTEIPPTPTQTPPPPSPTPNFLERVFGDETGIQHTFSRKGDSITVLAAGGNETTITFLGFATPKRDEYQDEPNDIAVVQIGYITINANYNVTPISNPIGSTGEYVAISHAPNHDIIVVLTNGLVMK